MPNVNNLDDLFKELETRDSTILKKEEEIKLLTAKIEWYQNAPLGINIMPAHARSSYEHKMEVAERRMKDGSFVTQETLEETVDRPFNTIKELVKAYNART